MKKRERALTQAQIAEELGVSRSVVQDDERRALINLKAIAEELGLTDEQVKELVQFG